MTSVYALATLLEALAFSIADTPRQEGIALLLLCMRMQGKIPE